MTEKMTAALAAFMRGLPLVSVGLAGMGLKFYGLSFISFLFIVQFLLSGFDILLGLYIAKRNKITNSHIMGDGGMTKVITIGSSLLLVIGLGHLSYISSTEQISLVASLMSMCIILFFCYKECISILENATIISEGEHKVVFTWMIKFLRWMGKIVGISVEMAKAKLEKKLENVLPSGVEPKDVINPEPPKSS